MFFAPVHNNAFAVAASQNDAVTRDDGSIDIGPAQKEAARISAQMSGISAGKVSNGLDYLSYDEISKLMSTFIDRENVATAKQYEYNKLLQESANTFTHNENALNRIFQQNSAKAAMEFEAEQARLNREFQQASADKQIEFQRVMSNTAYQRAVEDLRKAGLNPILAYTKGPSSTPSGASASGSSARGIASSGSSGSGASSSVGRANPSALASAVLSYSSNIVSNSAKLLGAVGSIIPF